MNELKTTKINPYARWLFGMLGLVIFYFGFKGISKRFDPIRQKEINFNLRDQTLDRYINLMHKILPKEDLHLIYHRMMESYDNLDSDEKADLLKIFEAANFENAQFREKIIRNLNSDSVDENLILGGLNYLLLKLDSETLKLINHLLSEGSEFSRLMTLTTLKNLCNKDILEILSQHEIKEVNIRLKTFSKKLIFEYSKCN